MFHPRTLLVLITALQVLSAGTVSAENTKPLEAEQVKAFLATIPELEALSDRHEDAGELLDTDIIQKDPASVFSQGLLGQSISAVADHPMYGEMQELVKAKGFDSVDDWVEIGDRVMVGYIHLQMSAKAPEMKAQMDMARQQVLSNEDIPEAQRKQMMKMLDQQAEVMNAMQEPEVLVEGDLEVIRTLQDEIEATINATDGD